MPSLYQLYGDKEVPPMFPQCTTNHRGAAHREKKTEVSCML